MPVDRDLAEDLAVNLRDLYEATQTRLAADIARRLADGIEAPDWAQRKLAAVTSLRRFAETLLQRLTAAMADEVAQAVILAHIRGGAAGLEELARAQSTHPEWLRLAELSDPGPRLRAMIERRQTGLVAELAVIRRELPGVEALQRLVFALTSTLRGTHLRILRWGLDAYREVVARAAADTLLGTATRLRAAQVAWESLLTRGVTGFVDRAGRRWELASYIEMATRTTTAQAAVEGHLDRLGAAGLDLVIVSNAPQECDRCRPWEGRVLARGGTSRRQTIEAQHATQDRTISVEVRGTVDDAVRDGLLHPNCRHSLSAYLPGVTRAPTRTEDPQGDADRQELRRLERELRGWKRREAAAIDPAARARAAAKVREWQARIRGHVADTGLIRQRQRERIGAAR